MLSSVRLPRDEKLSFVQGKKHSGEKLNCSRCCSLLPGAAEKMPQHHPTPRHCIPLHFSYISCCLRQAAFSSRTDALPTTWHGLCSCWELFVPLKPSTKALLNNGTCPLPDGCTDRSGKRLGLAGSQAGRSAARVNALVTSRQRVGSTPGRAGLAQQLQTGLRGGGPNFQRPKIISDVKDQVSVYFGLPKKGLCPY